MAERTGRCSNTDYCALGDARTLTRLDAAVPFICPECGRKLVQPGERRRVAGSVAAGLVTAGWVAVLALTLHEFGARRGPPVVTVLGTARVRAVPSLPVVALLGFAEADALPVVTSVRTIGLAAVQAVPPPVVMLRLAGSELLTDALAPRIAGAFLARRGDTEVEVRRIGVDEIHVVGRTDEGWEAVAILATGSAAGMQALAAGLADIALMGRSPRLREMAALPAFVLGQAATYAHVVAQVRLAVVGHVPARLKTLPPAQAQAIFATGQMPRGVTRAYVSDDLSDSGTAVSDVAAAVASSPGSIGLTPLARAGGNLVVATLDRPHALLLVGPRPQSDPTARDFVRFALSPAGQAAGAEAGFLAAATPVVTPVKSAPANPAPPAPPSEPAQASTSPLDDDAFRGMDRISDTTHVFSLPANARLTRGRLEDVAMSGGPPASATEAADPELARLKQPSPVNGVMTVDCSIELSGLPAHCSVVSLKGTKSGSGAVLEWLTSGAVRYAPAMQEGKPVVATRRLTVSFRPPGQAP